LEAVQGVSDVSVNLVLKSAACTIDKRETAHAAREAVEDAGYEAEIISVEAVQDEAETELENRTVNIRVDGMFCE
jgi:copper chaperone CopZ